METAQIAELLLGNKLYQQRAQLALPILVRQASVSTPITYGDLALELSMPNPRNLNYVLGSIGQTLEMLSENWGIEIPPLQCLVINKSTRLPGEGIHFFVSNMADYKNLSNKQRRQVVDTTLQEIYIFNKWEDILSEFGLKLPPQYFSNLSKSISHHKGRGEGKEHKALKEFISITPELLGLPTFLSPGEQEHSLPSGDCLDVFFKNQKEDIGVEVKSNISDVNDIIRGLFQCVKYQSVMEARQAVEGHSQNVRTFLVLGGSMPENLIPIKNILGVEVIDRVKIK